MFAKTNRMLNQANRFLSTVIEFSRLATNLT